MSRYEGMLYACSLFVKSVRPGAWVCGCVGEWACYMRVRFLLKVYARVRGWVGEWVLGHAICMFDFCQKGTPGCVGGWVGGYEGMLYACSLPDKSVV